MPLWRCNTCNQNIPYDRSNPEFYHEHASGKEVLDNVTILNLDSPNWNYQGQSNKVGGQTAGILGYNVQKLDNRGYAKATTKTKTNIIAVQATQPTRKSNVNKHPF